MWEKLKKYLDPEAIKDFEELEKLSEADLAMIMRYVRSNSDKKLNAFIYTKLLSTLPDKVFLRMRRDKAYEAHKLGELSVKRTQLVEKLFKFLSGDIIESILS